MGTLMENGIEEHYILFRDESVVASRIGTTRITGSGVKIAYGSAGGSEECDCGYCENYDLAAYVWCGAGKLTGRQAGFVLDKLRMEFKRRWRIEAEAQQNLNKESEKPLRIEVFQGGRYRKTNIIALLALPTLMDLWSRKGGESLNNPLQVAACAWIIEASDAAGSSTSLENRLLQFKMFLVEQELTLTPFQREVLATCVRITNLVSGADGCGGRDIEDEHGTRTKKTATKKQAKPGARENRPKQAPTQGAVNNALLAYFHQNRQAVYYSAARLAKILESVKPAVKCSASAVKGTHAWHVFCAPLRKKDKIISIEDAGPIEANQPQDDED